MEELSSEHQASRDRSIRGEDQVAEEELVRYFGRRLLAMFLARTRDRELARDLVQDAMIAVLQQVRRGAVREPERLTAFIHAVARNVVNYLRRRGRMPREEPLADNVSVATPPDQVEYQQREHI